MFCLPPTARISSAFCVSKPKVWTDTDLVVPNKLHATSGLLEEVAACVG
jgi:hypothetical protein